MPEHARPVGRCWCRCGRETRPHAFFVPGHDRRADTILSALLTSGNIVERLVAAGFHFDEGGRNLREEALTSGGFSPCPVEGCEVYGRGGGMERHRREHLRDQARDDEDDAA